MGMSNSSERNRGPDRPLVRLYRTLHFEDAWEAILCPWFRARSEVGMEDSGPTAVVVPNVSCAAFLKARLLEDEISAFGIHFFTARTLREFLLGQFPEFPPVVDRGDAGLLITLAAEGVPNSRVAQSVAPSPDAFLGLHERMTGAGWDVKSWENREAEEISAGYSILLERVGLQTMQQADQRLLQCSGMTRPLLEEILLYGLSERDWPLWPLLSSAIELAKRATVIHLEEGLDDAGRCWLGTWEEHYGFAETVAERWNGRNSGFERIAENFEGLVEAGVGESLPKTIIYRIGQDAGGEAEAIVAQALTFLAEAGSVRLGIVFSRPSALSRVVTAHLIRLGIPHYDALGNVPGRGPKEQILDAWIRLQEEQRLDALIDFSYALSTGGFVAPDIPGALEATFERAVREVLTDNLDVLKAFVLAAGVRSTVGEFLSCWSLLPEAAPMDELISATEVALSSLGWSEMVSNLRRKARYLDSLRSPKVSLGSFCRWLRGINREPQRSRNELGQNPFSRVHILSFDEFSGETWSHLIVGGLNSEEWPRVWAETGLLSADYMGKLNRAAMEQGRQGEGHVVLKANHSWIYSSSEERMAGHARFVRLLRAPSRGLALTMSAERRTTAPETITPSEFLMRVYWIDRGRLLDTDTVIKLIEETSGWLGEVFENAVGGAGRIERMLSAFKARRDPEQPFGEFEFSYRAAPAGGLLLSSSAWDVLMERPAEVWLTHVMKLRRRPCWSEESVRDLAHGSWVHSWLRIGDENGGLVPFPKTDDWRESLRCAAEITRGKVSSAYCEAGRRVPDWLMAQLNEAAEAGDQFIDRLGNIDGWSHLASERSLPETGFALLSDGTRMPIQGRMDLLLANGRVSDLGRDDAWPADASAWIIDFKTGSGARPLTSRNFAKGYGLQVGLYAKALVGLGCQNVAMSIARPGSAVGPQIDQEDLVAAEALWQEIAAIHKSGVVGQIGELRSDFAFKGNYPHATLRVDPAVLEGKRALTRRRLAQGHESPRSG